MDTSEAQQVNRALVKVARLYRAVQGDYLADLGLHPGQEVLLWTLGQAEDGLLVSELAARLGIEPPTVTRSLARLESGSWFTRMPEPADRRAVRIRLTARGRDALARIEQLWSSLADTATAGLDPADRGHLVTLLERVQDNLRAVAAPDAELPEASL